MTQALLVALFVCVAVVNAIDLSVLDDQPPPVDKRATCVDKNSCCGYLKQFCNFHWVKNMCAKTCQVCKVTVRNCKPGTKDQNDCGIWKGKGYCKKGHRYYNYMMEFCPIACGVCSNSAVNIKECLQAHNSKRALHGAAPLTWDQNIAKAAQAYAEKLAAAKSRILQHDNNRGPYGENLALYITWGNVKNSFTCEKAVNMFWYKEANIYNYGLNKYQPKAGHFSQIVWKSTKRLGVGIARNGGYIYVVARYSPAGNVHGQFRQNVGRPRG